MSSLTFLSLRPILRLLPRSTRSHRHRVQPYDLAAVQTLSTPLDRGSTVPLCAVCIEAGRATEATHQTRDLLCGCDEDIQQLEQHGRAAVRRQRSAEPHGYMDREAPPAGGTNGNRPADSRDQGTGLGDGSAGPSDDRVVVVPRTAAKRRAWRYEWVEGADELDRWTSKTKVTRRALRGVRRGAGAGTRQGVHMWCKQLFGELDNSSELQ